MTDVVFAPFMKQNIIQAVVLCSLLLVFSIRAAPPIAGIGVALGIEANTLKIMKVLPGTPADRAHLSPGWIVQRIDNVATDGKRLEDSVAMLRGAAGSKVKLELLDTLANRTNKVELIREQVL